MSQEWLTEFFRFKKAVLVVAQAGQTPTNTIQDTINRLEGIGICF
jgi:hypothetical protein